MDWKVTERGLVGFSGEKWGGIQTVTGGDVSDCGDGYNWNHHVYGFQKMLDMLYTSLIGC